MTRPVRALQAADRGRVDLDAIVAALSTRYAVSTGPRQLVRRTRLDTFDRRLRAAGLTLEHQTQPSLEQLVLGRSGVASTLAVPVSDLRWPALADVLPMGPVREAVARETGIRALMVTSDERRRLRRLDLHNAYGKTVVRVELDEPVSAAAAPAQLSVHAMRGYDEHARRAAQVLVGLGLRAVEQDDDREPASAPATADTNRAMPASVLLSRALSDFLEAMRENVPGVIDDVDTEFLHDFRVAVRRTRATLKLGRPALPEVMRSRWEPAFKWLGDLTTPVRDLDVYELDLPTMREWLVATDPADLDALSTHLRRRRTAERRALVRGLRSARFRRLVTEWEAELAWLGEMPDDADGGSGADTATDSVDAGHEFLTAGRLADGSISRAYDRVARGGAAISGDSPAEDLHRLRKRCKDLRYALEVCAPVVAKGPRTRAVSDLKGLQDVLGRFQDSEVQRHALRGFAEEMMSDGAPTGAVLAMGELIGHLDAEQDRARHEFDAAFAQFARPSNQLMMHRLGGRS